MRQRIISTCRLLCIRLTTETLQQWAGELRYHHRSKLCVLQQAVPLASKTVFIDTDTFFLRDPARLFVGN
jgi:hypothetical protein